jgi:hypothetical protein
MSSALRNQLDDKEFLEFSYKDEGGKFKPVRMTFADCLSVTLIGNLIFSIEVEMEKLPPDGTPDIQEVTDRLVFFTEKQDEQKAYIEEKEREENYRSNFPSLGETF